MGFLFKIINMKKSEDRVIILLGPTSVGKTGVSTLFAKALDTEIISADSMQVYRGMDIGTAKPSPEMRRLIRHHMIDIVDPSETYSAGRYISEIRPVIDSLHNRGRIPLIVGGTGLYIKALTRGIFRAPGADAGLRACLNEMEGTCPGRLYEELKKADPERAASINPADRRRVIRAVEVILKTGRPMSLLQREMTTPLPYRFIKIGLTRQRKELYRMIGERVDAMFEEGLVDEVRGLLTMNPSGTPLQAIGYKEVIAYLNGEIGLEEARELIKKATRRYAKKQLTWFKKEEDIQWVDITGLQSKEEIFERVNDETVLSMLLKA